MRDMQDYSNQYLVPSFEVYKVAYRRKKILERVAQYSPKKLLEIGCGNEPLFCYLKGIDVTFVEPSDLFFNNAMELAAGNKYVHGIQGFFEDVISALTMDYDMIICASLLHEVDNPTKLLTAISKVCNERTIVNIIVPNANSMHRLLGASMEILNNIHDKTTNNKKFQQNMVFDLSTLKSLVIKHGFMIVDSGSFFIKPFSHEQMLRMMQTGIVDEEVLDGLYKLGEEMPEYGSEIFVNCKLK